MCPIQGASTRPPLWGVTQEDELSYYMNGQRVVGNELTGDDLSVGELT